MTSKFAFLVLLMVATLSVDATAQVAQELRESRQRLDRIRSERNNLEDELTRIQGRARSITSEIGNIEQQKNATNRIVNEIDRQIAGISAQIDTITFDLILAQDALAEKRAILDWRISEVYKRGRLWTFQVLLQAESFGDLISRYKYLYLASRQDRRLVDEVEALAVRITDQRQQLVALRQQTERNRDERTQELQRFVDLERQRQRALASLRGSVGQTAQQIEQLSERERELTAMIADLERRRREAESRGEFSGPPRITDALLGELPWPMDGELIYGYGQQRLPNGLTRRNDGIGIAAPPGTPVRAVAGGRVLMAEGFSLSGPMVVLDHGGGYLTIYMQLSELSVREGQIIDSGDQVGLSGGVSRPEGPHIEFQIRAEEGQITYDPENWLRPRPRRRN